MRRDLIRLATAGAALTLALHAWTGSAQTEELNQTGAQRQDQSQQNGGGTMESVTSRDGTRIAYDRIGNGPPVILVCGGSVDRTSNAPLAALLAEQFTVFNYDRRGRGDSGDTLPYAVQREIEDLEAVISAAGGS